MTFPSKQPQASKNSIKSKPNGGQTGPKTPNGKAISAVNAVKTGLHVSGWIDKSEELEYEELFRDLCTEYNAQTTTLLLQLERMATTMVKMRRLQKIEAALFQKARNLAELRVLERQSIPSLSSADPETTMVTSQLAAIPDMDRLSTLQRYQTSLDRQLSKVIGEIRVLTSNATSTLQTHTISIHRSE